MEKIKEPPSIKRLGRCWQPPPEIQYNWSNAIYEPVSIVIENKSNYLSKPQLKVSIFFTFNIILVGIPMGADY